MRRALHSTAVLSALLCAALCAGLALTNAAIAEATASDPLAIAEQAQADYDRGMSLRATDSATSLSAFQESARKWQRVIDSGASNGALHFNLGNAHAQSGDVGRAIASYLRAERSMPGNPDLEQNLKQARSRVQHAFARGGGTLLVDSVARWWHVMPLGMREAVAWLSWTVFWAALLAWLLVPRLVTGTPARDAARKLTLVGSLLLWFIFGGTLIADQVLSTVRPLGVLVEPAVQLRKGNGDGFDPAFAETLSPGVEFGILEERPGWWRIELPDGRSGWIKHSQATRV